MGNFVNKIFHANCFDIMAQMPNEIVDMVLSDCPYGISYKANHREKPYQFDDIKSDEDLSFIPKLLSELFRITKSNAHCYLFCHYSKWHLMWNMVKDSQWNMRNMIIWEKNNWTGGSLDYQWAVSTELIAYMTKGKRKLNGRRPVDVIHCDRIDPLKLLHPTQKPTGVTNKIMKASSAVGDLVFDPFAGSGSTLVSACRMGRDYCGCEIDEKYFKILKRRIDEESNTLF